MIDAKQNYIIHTDYDDQTDVGVYGPIPDDADFNDATFDLWSQCGDIETVTGAHVVERFGDHDCNDWSIWLAFGNNEEGN